MSVEVVSDGPRRPAIDFARMPVASVLVAPGKRFDDLAACRLIRVEATHPGEWPWRRLTGVTADVPPRDSDLSEWQPQPLGDLALVLAHATVLSGHEVSR